MLTVHEKINVRTYYNPSPNRAKKAYEFSSSRQRKSPLHSINEKDKQLSFRLKF